MAFVADQFFYSDMATQSDEFVDFDQFLDLSSTYGDDYSASVNSISPEMALPDDADMLGNDLPEFSQPAFPDMINYDMSPEVASLDQSPNMGWTQEPAPVYDDAMSQGYQPYDPSFDFRQMVEAQAAADPRIASAKEKRREAAIALHLQRLCDATALEVDMSSDSNTSFSSPNLSDYMRESFSPQPVSASPERTPAPPPAQGNGGMELVLDLNMNATTNLPKKQKPRSQAQRENYIKARKYGACEKHKKQHKRCNCLEKAAARAGVSEVPMNAGFRERPKYTGFPMPIIPASRSSDVPGLPGHVPSITTPNSRPTSKVIKRLSGTDPSRYDSPLAASPLQQPTKTTTVHNGSSPGHNPQLSPTAVQPFVRDTKRTSSSPGRAPLSAVQSGNVTQKPVLQTSSRPATIGFSPTNNAVLCAGNKNSSQTSTRSSTSDTRTPDLAIRRPKVGVFKRQVTDESPSPTVNANNTHSSTAVRSPGVLGLSALNRRQVILECSRQPLAILTARAGPAPRSGNIVTGGTVSPGLFGPNNSIARSATAQIGSLFSRTVLSIAGAWHSSLSFASFSEELLYKGLSIAGKHLMSAKKGLQLYNMRTFWSA